MSVFCLKRETFEGGKVGVLPLHDKVHLCLTSVERGGF